MELVIRFDDGTTEKVPARAMANIVSAWGRWRPGVELEREPERCRWGSDFFSAAMNEGDLRSGREEPFGYEEPEVLGFEWEMVGSEQEDCRRMMDRWIGRLGSRFDPEFKAGEYLYGGLLQVLADRDAKSYDEDWQCWSHYFDDPRAEAAELLKAAGLEPSWSEGNPGHAP